MPVVAGGCPPATALTLPPQLHRKMEERRLRLQEAANRCVSSRGSGDSPEDWWELLPLPLSPEAPSWLFLPRRFCSQVALTPEEREQRALYAAILEYEQDHVSAGSRGRGCHRLLFPGPVGLGSSRRPRESVDSVALVFSGAALVGKHAGIQPCSPKSSAPQDWPKHWKARLKKSPGDLSLVTSLVSHLLRYQGLPPSLHPVGPNGRQTTEKEEEEIRAGCTGHPQDPFSGLGLQTSQPAFLLVF